VSLSAIDQLIMALGKLPGIGPRSARRLALHIAKEKDTRIPPLTQAFSRALDEIIHCEICGGLDDQTPCRICDSAKRDHGIICVVEDVADIWAIERSHAYNGLYHVLGGTLSALHGKGPEQLRIISLLERIAQHDIREILLALSATVSGQTTAHYVAEKLTECNVDVTRLAQGIPVGGELDYLDDGTLSAALSARLPF
jgi:recombination protein RecR